MGELTQNGFEISGTTANRPDNVEEGQPYFNESLGVWQVRNAAGTPVWQGPYIGVKWSMAAHGSWQLANDGARTNGGGIVGDVTLTNQVAAFAKAFDDSEGAGTWGNIADHTGRSGYGVDYELFPDAEGVAADDAIAFGGAVPFCEIALDIGTAAIYDAADVLVWQYSTGVGSWSSLTIITDQTDTSDQSGGRAFQQDGAISFIPPADWASVAVGGETAYWIRAVVDSGKAANMTTLPILNLVEHDIVTPLDGFTCPHGGTITGIRVIDAAITLHSGSTVKFILMNFTTGAHSAPSDVPHEWTASQQQDAFTSLTLAVNTGDELGVLVTQEDSGNDDPTNVMLELNVSAP